MNMPKIIALIVGALALIIFTVAMRRRKYVKGRIAE